MLWRGSAPWWCLCQIICLVGCATWLAGCTTRPEPADTRVQFHRDIAPIFQTRCESCHRETNRQGGLRLDVREFALKGGLSGKPLVSPSADDSELLRRITSDDPAVVMPKEGGRLPNVQVDLIRQWIKEGAAWPDVVPPSGSREFWNRYGADLWDRLSVAGQELKPWYLLLLTLLLGTADRIRRANPDQAPWSAGWGRAAWRVSQHASAHWFVIGLLTIVMWDVVEFSMRQTGALAQTEEQLRRKALTFSPPDTLQGAAPKPLRPHYTPPLGGTYYRGNDERNEQLFNGGHYRTATMRVALVNEHDEPLEIGQKLSGRQLFIRLDIERARSATPSLFNEESMRGVLLSRRTSETKQPMPEDEPTVLQTVTLGERWAGRYRLGEYDHEPEAALDGVLYVYTGSRSDEAVHGTIHYGIVFSLRIADHTLRDNSELWLGPVLLPGNFQAHDPTKITLPEWLDTQPIPEIIGKNSADPKLLGIPAHQQSP